MNYTSGASHLGDCVWSLTWLRRIAGQHTFFCPAEYHWQLQDLCEGREINLKPQEEATPDALNTWIGCQRFSNQGVVWALNPDLVDFLMKWGNCMCRENGMGPQFIQRSDMLADWPEIERFHDEGEFDALVINCPPKSGQCPRWDQGEMDELIQEIAGKHRTIVTNPTTATNVKQVNLSLSKIGNLALQAKFVVAVASGASWGMHSIWSQEKPKYIFLDDPLNLDYGAAKHMPRHGLVRYGMRVQLQNDGWI